MFFKLPKGSHSTPQSSCLISSQGNIPLTKANSQLNPNLYNYNYCPLNPVHEGLANHAHVSQLSIDSLRAWQAFQLRFDSTRQSCEQTMRSKSERPRIGIEGNNWLLSREASAWRERLIVAQSLSCFTLSSSSSASVTCKGRWDTNSGTFLVLLEEDSIASFCLVWWGHLDQWVLAF